MSILCGIWDIGAHHKEILNHEVAKATKMFIWDRIDGMGGKFFHRPFACLVKCRFAALLWRI
jgi:hypothetical protein